MLYFVLSVVCAVSQSLSLSHSRFFYPPLHLSVLRPARYAGSGYLCSFYCNLMLYSATVQENISAIAAATSRKRLELQKGLKEWTALESIDGWYAAMDEHTVRICI